MSDVHIVTFLDLFKEGVWKAEGACRGMDPDLFFPGRGESTAEAKKTCRECVVREECLDYSLANGEKFGIWGGLSERERKAVRRTLVATRKARCRICAEEFTRQPGSRAQTCGKETCVAEHRNPRTGAGAAKSTRRSAPKAA